MGIGSQEERVIMRLPILAATAALMACPAAAQTPDAPPIPPRPMQDTPPPRPSREAPPATLPDADAACRRGDRPACAEADKIRARILAGGALVPDPPPASGGGGPPPKGDRP
jgi:hypothetical protein